MAKKTVYESLILGILLYGGESWSNTEVMLDRLRVFHARCVRSMCRVSRKHTWQHHISTGELEQRLGLDTIDMYLKRRQLRWLGHVARMDYAERLPRRMLSVWVPQSRPRGAPQRRTGEASTRHCLTSTSTGAAGSALLQIGRHGARRSATGTPRASQRQHRRCLSHSHGRRALPPPRPTAPLMRHCACCAPGSRHPHVCGCSDACTHM